MEQPGRLAVQVGESGSPVEQARDVASPGPRIGVFDSGFGGLTVLRALLPLISGARYSYLGDTARLPYGAKSRETIARYAVSSARFLEEQGAELLVIACNTASALALDEIRAASRVPVVGVIEPGTRAALAAGHAPVLVLATAATVASHAYLRSCEGVGLRAVEKACPLLVPLIEEGWIEHPVTEQVLRIYLEEALALFPVDEDGPATMLLGCTHYPMLEGPIRRVLAEMGRPLGVIDAAEATALTVAERFKQVGGFVRAECRFFATDSVEKFRRLGGLFLGQQLPAVELVDLGE